MATTKFGSAAWPFAGVGNARATLRIADPGFPTGVTLFVDENHPGTGDAHAGTDPNFPLTTIQAAVNKVTRQGTTIAVAPGTYAENVIIPVTYDNCRIIGMGANPYQVQVGVSSATIGYTFQVLAEGWEFANMMVYSFGAAATDLGAFHLAGGDSAVGTAAGVVGEAQYTHIHDCVIRGSGNPDVLVGLDGAPWYVVIENNLFIQATGTAACAVKVISTSTSVPQKNVIRGNIFQAINDDGNGFHYYGETKYSMFLENYFGGGYGAAVKFLNVDGLGGAGAGTYNLIAGNVFGTNAGGTQEYDTTNIVASAATNMIVGNYALPLGGASDTCTYGINHAVPDAAA